MLSLLQVVECPMIISIGFMNKFTPLLVKATFFSFLFFFLISVQLVLLFIYIAMKNILLSKVLSMTSFLEKNGRLSPPVEQVLCICLLCFKILCRTEHIILLHSNMNDTDAIHFFYCNGFSSKTYKHQFLRIHHEMSKT